MLQVDSVSCCRVDAGLKTVVGARKFVPGAKICIQPDIQPNGPKPRNPRRDRSRTQAPLLPGLPDDLAISCLIRVARVDHQNLRSLEAAAFVSLNGKLAVIRNNMSISLVDVSNPGRSVETNSAHLWETISGKGQLKTFVSNIWSSIAGRNGLKSHIVHCQVLQWRPQMQPPGDYFRGLLGNVVLIFQRNLAPHHSGFSCNSSAGSMVEFRGENVSETFAASAGRSKIMACGLQPATLLAYDIASGL
ncbi:F-box/kelch-repeat protein [Platanthera guangdongensis]|uniref:F-box/kelch-repeat protein n=1 Tax=Platanthera guangdongensis TaxID=2320717 RepID=A0ABR2MF26_9ASPA